MWIFDVFVFIYEYYIDDEMVLIFFVKEEFIGEYVFCFDVFEGVGMYVYIFGQGIVDKVFCVVGEIGDCDVFLEIDMCFIVVVFEFDVMFVIDDYVMQNVVEWFNVGVEVIV